MNTSHFLHIDVVLNYIG